MYKFGMAKNIMHKSIIDVLRRHKCSKAQLSTPNHAFLVEAIAQTLAHIQSLDTN